MVMTIDREAIHTTSDNTQWQSLTLLADKMGELDTPSPEEEGLETARRESLTLLDVLADGDTTEKEREALTAKWINSLKDNKEVWSIFIRICLFAKFIKYTFRKDKTIFIRFISHYKIFV